MIPAGTRELEFTFHPMGDLGKSLLNDGIKHNFRLSYYGGSMVEFTGYTSGQPPNLTIKGIKIIEITPAGFREGAD